MREAAPWWDGADFRVKLSFTPNSVRYPGGTTANYWDWRTGNHIPGSRSLIPDASLTIEEFARSLPSGTQAVFCVNLARPTPATQIAHDASQEVLESQATLSAKIQDILAGINEWRRHFSGAPMIEIGNEFYDEAEGGIPGQGAIYSDNVELYIQHADQTADAIRAAHPDAKIAIVGHTSRNRNQPSAWDSALYSARLEGLLDHVDALTWHLYTGPGISSLNSMDDSERSVSQALHRIARSEERDFAFLPETWEAWITEYNCWSPAGTSPIEGTWTNAMFSAAMTLATANASDQVAILMLHNLQGDLQWSQLQRSASAEMTPLGQAMHEIYSASRGTQTLTPLRTTDGPVSMHGHPLVIGIRVGGPHGEKIILLNLSKDAIDAIDIEGSVEHSRSSH